MAITYASAAGSIITSFLVTQALGSQAQQSGNNTIVLDNIPSLATGYGGNVGVGTLGVGDTYLGRRIMIGRGGTIQERIVTADAAGTGSTRILTVHEDWDTNPVATTDTVDVYYELADVEEGGAGGGISLQTRTGLWTLTRIITMGNGTDPAGLAMTGGQALECADRGTSDSFLVSNNGFFRAGYYAGGVPIAGGVIALTSAADDEPAQSFASGSNVAFLDTLIWAQVATLSQISNAGASVVYDKCKLLKTTEECELYAATIINCAIAGEAKATEIVRFDPASSVFSLVLSDLNSITNAVGASGTIELEGVIFSGVAAYIDIRASTIWNMIDPVWDVTVYTQLNFLSATGTQVNEKRSVKVTAQESDGTLLQNAVIVLYEHTINAAIELELTTDVAGYVEDAFVHRAHTSAATVTHGAHALRADKWLYSPYVAAQLSTAKFNGSITLAADSNIVQTTQATAITDGSGTVLNEDTNPSELFAFTLGSGTLAEGMIITFTSGAVGTITESKSGDSTAGEIHLKDSNATAITNGDTFSRTGGTAGTFSGTYTNSTAQKFSIWIDANSLSYQTQHDYWAARSAEIPLAAHGIAAHEWGRASQARILYKSGSDFYTEQSNSKGVILIHGGAGALSYFTDDSGTQWTPPTSITLKFVVKDSDNVVVVGAYAYIDDDNALPYIMNTTTNGSGEASTAHSDGAIVGTTWRVRKYGYKPFVQTVDIGTSDITLPVTLITDPQQT